MTERLPGSFRDPSGFVFIRNGVLYRQVNQFYRPTYDQVKAGGLYEELFKAGWLIPHTEVKIEPAEPDSAYLVLQPEPVPFISYPYEWCFGQLKAAALATLAIQIKALEAGFTLKDASAFNIQFVSGRPVLIDSLSFDVYQDGAPWVAYRQFCEHFLAPLALMAYRDVRLNNLSRIYIDGLPLDLVSRLLPIRARTNLGLLVHLYGHSAGQKRWAG